MLFSYGTADASEALMTFFFWGGGREGRKREGNGGGGEKNHHCFTEIQIGEPGGSE